MVFKITKVTNPLILILLSLKYFFIIQNVLSDIFFLLPKTDFICSYEVRFIDNSHFIKFILVKNIVQ